MKPLYIAPVGSVAGPALDWVEAAAEEWFPFPVRRLPPLAVPPETYDAERRQHQSAPILERLARITPPNAARLLGVTEVDLAIPMLSFLFGHAQLDGPVALISLCRLRQEFYGLPLDAELLRGRTVKEALHELGHTFALTHCERPECVMSLATHIALVDGKSERYCRRCGARLAKRVAAANGELL